MKLHLGCGPIHIEGFVHIDAKADGHVDHVGPVEDLSHIADDSIELVYACHVLEHFDRHQYLSVLAEWHRVIQPGGILRVSVPDFEKTAQVYLNRELLVDGLRSLWGALIGGQRDEFDYHKMFFDRESLDRDLRQVGFQTTRLWDWRTTEHSHIDDHSQAYLPHMDKENGILMSLNMEAVKAAR